MQDVLTAAIEMHRSGQLGAASQLYQRVLAREQENAEALHLLGVLHHQQGNHARDRADRPGGGDQAQLAHLTTPTWRRRTALLGDFDRAAGCCRAALRSGPTIPRRCATWARPCKVWAREPRPSIICTAPWSCGPISSWPTATWGSRARPGAEDEALEHFRRAVELDATFAPAQTNLGQTLLDLGQAGRGLPHCQEAVRLDPNSAVLHHNLGNTLRVLERLVDAKVSYLEALRLDPKLAVSNAHLGLVLQKEGQLSDALVWLKKAVELEPGQRRILAVAGRAARRDGGVRRGDSLLGARGRARSGSGLGASLAWAGPSRTNRDLQEAREHYDAGVQLQPDFAAAYLNLGGLQEELGDMVAAERSFRTALEKQPTLCAAARSAGDLAALQAARSRPGRARRAFEG